ncbi:MAG: pyroglutamyl-peptidase I, partial [Oscillospiraceae bacterium]|nr:pyroglutamyl-peptidase I [Oscillospiraceae bacterium]
MKKLLITGFDPFGGESVNPSWEAVRQLPDRIGQYELTKMQIPTVFGKAFEEVLAAAEALQPDAVISVGQAGGRDSVTPEVVAINLREA